MRIKAITSGERYDSYAKRTDPVMIVLALLFLVIWTLTSIDTALPLRLGRALLVLNALIWVVFAIDLAIRIVIAKSSWRFIVKHPLDVLAVLVPMLRPLKILAIFTTGNRIVTGHGILKTGQAVLVSAVLLVWVGAVAIFNVESGRPGAMIESFGDALWWAVVTVTTVGFGDFVPVTATGRVLASGLMVVGIALIGVVTASVAAWFVRLTTERGEREGEASLEKNAAEIRRLSHKVESLEEKIDLLVEKSGGGG
jgi:voltage-gated potassium channel